MAAVDEFLSSVRDVFSRNRDTDWSGLGMLLVCATSVTVSLGIWRARRRSARALASGIAAIVARAQLSRREVAFLRGIAQAAGLGVLEVMTRLPAFERATAAVLAAQSPTVRPTDGSPFEQISRLRKALGFSPLPAHHWLGSTRELVNGDPITLAGVMAPVVVINEASFAVDLPAAVAPAAGSEVAMTIVRQEDSRYLTRVRVLVVEAVPVPPPDEGSAPLASPGSGGGSRARRVFFAHDEQPERQQNREHVRIRMQGPVTLTFEPAAGPSAGPGPVGDTAGAEAPMAEPSPGARANEAGVTGSLVDVSAGGLSLDLQLPAHGLPRAAGRAGTHVRCSFSLGEGAAFDGLRARVVALETKAGVRLQRMRLSFKMSDVERDRLAAAVARHQRGLADAAGS